MADPTTHGNFSAADFQGTINEDVKQAVFDISNIELPFTEMVGAGTADNHYTEWVEDKLSDPSVAWTADGADVGGDDSTVGMRLGNHTGIMTRRINVSQAAQDADSIGGIAGLSYQAMQRMSELGQSYEVAFLGSQGNTADSGDGVTPGVPAGLAAQLTQFDTGSGATGGGFTGGNWTQITAGTGVPLTETMIRDAMREAYADGGRPSKLMMNLELKQGLSEYLFTSSSRIATLTRETKGLGPGDAIGAVDVFVTDFGVIELIGNWLMGFLAGGPTNQTVYLLDPSYIEISWLTNYTVENQGKTGLSDKQQLHANGTVCALNRDAGRVLLDIDATAPVTQA